MLIDFISMIAIGFAIGGSLLLVNHMTGRRVPKWTMPAAVGVAMLGFTIWNEYSWASRYAALYPETAVVTFRNSQSQVWRPWTYLAPVTTRMAMLDRGPEAALPADPGPDYRLARIHLLERWKPSYALTVVFDCAGGRRADAGVEGATAEDLTGANWLEIDRNDAAFMAACGGGVNG